MRCMVVNKKLFFLPTILLLFFPFSAFATSATYINSTDTSLPSNASAVQVTSTIDVSDDFPISDLNLTLAITGANLANMDATLVNPQGTRVNLYSQSLGGRNFSNTTFDDEATKTVNQGTQPWTGSFKPIQSLTALDSQSMLGTWTLELNFTAQSQASQRNSSNAILDSWTLTAQGASPGTIAGTTYKDNNANGQKDNSENGLENWTIFLDQNNNRVLDSGETSTTTDSNGNYSFPDLALNDYFVREVEQVNWVDIKPGTKIQSIRTHHNETTTDINFGNLPTEDTTFQTYAQNTTNNHTLTITDSTPIADLDIELSVQTSNLAQERIALKGPDGTEVELYSNQLNGNNFSNTVFDDEAIKTVNQGAQPWTGSFRPTEFLGLFNTKNTQGTWELIGPSTGQLLSWKLHIRSPIKQEPDPIILVPGMMVSFNPVTTLGDLAGGKWDFAPGSRPLYQALIERLGQQGFAENQNLFISHYDWRNPVSDAAANYLKPAIDHAKQVTGSDQVNIVAHSMGGLVSRAYIQSSDYNNDVNHLITLGTPNLGASGAYVAWEGGEVPQEWDAGIRFYLTSVENALRIKRAALLPRPLSFRTFFPSLKDLLPIQNYANKNSAVLPFENLTEQNPFLQRLQDTTSLLSGITLTTIAGQDQPTLNEIELTPDRTATDILLDRWRDGHPNPDPPAVDSEAGDHTVMLSSALFGSNQITLPNTAHDKLPEAAQEEVLAALGLDSSGPHIAYTQPKSLVGTVVLSPVTPSITLPDGTIFQCDNSKVEQNFECIVDETDPNGPKLLVVSDPPDGKFSLKFTGTGSGEYHAITCFADDDQDACGQIENTTTPGKIDIVPFTLSEDTFIPPDITPPVVTITTPPNAARYLQNQVVIANWTVVDDGSGISESTLQASAPSGKPINTTTLGNHAFTVNAEDLAGNKASASTNYIVQSGDILVLVKQLRDRTFDLLLQKHIKPIASKLSGIADLLLAHTENYVKESAKSGKNSPKAKEWYKKMQADFTVYKKELAAQIKAKNLDSQATTELNDLITQISFLGL